MTSEGKQIIALAGGRHVRPDPREVFAFASLVQALEPGLVVHDSSPLSARVAEHLVRTCNPARKIVNEVLAPFGADTDVLVLWPGAEGLRAVAARLGVLVVNAKAIRSHLLRGNEWTREQVLDRLAGMRRRAAEAVQA